VEPADLIEHGINGLAADERLRIRKDAERAVSDGAGSIAARSALPPVALDLGRRTDRLHAQALEPICALHRRRQHLPQQNAAEHALRGFVRRRKSWLLAGS
jgi:hypothetical protein